MPSEKWRETLTEVSDLPLKKIQIIEVLSYPYAGNDVFECIGLYENTKKHFFIKCGRGNTSNIDGEISILNKIKDLIIEAPNVLEHGVINDSTFICTEKVEGIRLSDILSKEKDLNFKYQCLKNYGRKLAFIHSLSVNCDKAKLRKINNIVENKDNDLYVEKIVNWLKSNEPKIEYNTFIHGDFHYANILWDNKTNITGIIDWEYSGKGFKEQDIAWALVVRSTQKFMKTKKEIIEFLKGYRELGNYDMTKLKWCLVNAYLHFYVMNKKETKYREKLQYFIKSLIEKKGDLL